MNRKNWLEIDEKSLRVNKNDLKKRLSPLLRGALDKEKLDTLASDIERSCQKVVSYLLPLKDKEREFLRILNEKGEIRPEIITDDKELADRIKKLPMLKWKALNVRQTLQADQRSLVNCNALVLSSRSAPVRDLIPMNR